MMKKISHRRKSQSGNIFFMLFASVALVGAFGVGASNVMKGLVSSMSDVTRKTIAEEKMMSGGRLAIQGATVGAGAGDCDADGFVEPLPFVATAGPAPVGGGLLPADIGATEKDPWGTPYGYCVWDPGPTQDAAGCGTAGARLNGTAITTDIVTAVISAGKDRKFSTTCAALPTGVTATAGSDDIVMEYTYNDASGLSGDDLWRVQDTNPDTAMIDKDIEVAGDASMEGVLELRRRGLLLPDDTETGACTALNESELRVNTTASPPILEICYDTVWEPISMGGGGGTGGSCGTSWQTQTAPARNWQSVAFGNNIFAAVASFAGTSGVMTSPDGVTWTQRTTPFAATSIAFGSGRFVAADGAQGNGIMTSEDGITWTARTTPVSSEWGNVIYAGGQFVVVPEGSNQAMTSPDGITWTARTLPASSDWRGLAYGNGLYVTSRISGGTARSSDGITWTSGTGPVAYSKTLDFGNGLFVGGVFNTPIYTSADGISWTATTSITDLSVIKYVGGRFIALPSVASSTIYISEDGVTWNSYTAPLGEWQDITFANNQIVAVGQNVVMTSDCVYTPPPPTVGPEVAVPDALVHLKLDEQSGTSVSDTMNTATVSLTGATTPPTVTGVIGRAYDLDGTNDRILISSNSTLNSLSRFTIAFWTFGLNSGSFQYMLDTRNSGSNGLRLVRNDITNNITLTIGNGGNFVTNETVPNSVWTHVALTYDTANLSQAPVIYINGVAATYSSSTIPTAYTNPGSNWSIGSNVAGSTAWNPGRFDDFKVFGQILSQEQITLLYNDRSSTAYVAPDPIAIIAAGKYRGKISVDDLSVCGIKEDNSAWCWGQDVAGSLGNGTVATSSFESPSRVETQTLENSFIQISFGDSFACGLKADRTAWCWGSDASGQLGNTLTGNQANPSVVQGTTLWSQIATGNSHTCGISKEGDLYCWGLNTNGQLGTGIGSQSAPTLVTESGPWVYVDAGSQHTCAIKADGSAWCWGSQDNGRLGNGLTVAANIVAPTPVLEAGPWTKVSPGGNFSCGLKLDGSAWCWGSNINAKIAIGSLVVTDYSKPQRIRDSGPWIDIDAGSSTACGIKYDGTLWCWGRDHVGQAGNGNSSNTDISTPQRVTDPGPWAAVSVDGRATCGIKTDGSAWCWGQDTSGILGNGTVITAQQDSPSRVENFPNVAPFAFNDAQTVLTRNTAATTISLGQNGGRIGFDAQSGGFGYTGSGRSILANPTGNSGLALEAIGAFDSQLSFKTVTGATTRSIGVDNVTGNLEFGNNVTAVTSFMSAITPQLVINRTGQVGIGTQAPAVKLDISGGGLRIGNDTRTCTLSRRGVLRYNGTVIQYCNGTAWTGF